jgi:hypothetical protein
MRILRQILAGFTLLLASLILLLSLVVGIGVWIVKGPVTAKVTRTFERIDAALDIADQGLDHVKTSLDNAAERLDKVRQDRRQLPREPAKLNAARRFLSRTVQRQVAPEISDANEKLHTVAEAAFVVNSILEDLGNFEFLSVAGLDLRQLTEMNNQLAGVAPAAWDLSRLIGESPAAPGSDTDTAQLSRVDRTLKTIRGLVAEYEPQLTQVRQRTEALKSRTLRWITPAVALVSVISFWIALSQVSLLCHAWSWWKHSV